jgi:tripartite-type tricarboxylate transporter receptor subunit TctC
VHPTLPVKNVKDLIALVRAKPGKVEFGSGGIGSTSHLAGAMFNTMTGLSMPHVPYKGGNLALNDLLGGHISLTFSTTITSSEFIKSGKVRALAVTSDKRVAAFPNLPTVAESGVPGYEFSLWMGLAAPASTPSPIIQQLNKSLVSALQNKDLQSSMQAQSFDTMSSTPQEFSQKIKRDIGIYAKLVKSAGVTND